MTLGDPKAEEFLSMVKKGTEATYRIALQNFAGFYQNQGYPRPGTLKDFREALNVDRKADYGGDNVAGKTMKAYVAFLKDKGKSRKTIRCYAAAVQSYCRYVFKAPIIDLKYAELPTAIVQSRKHPWTLETVSKFISSFPDPMYQALAGVLFQSGLSISDALTLTWKDIMEEFQKGTIPLCLDFIAVGRRKTGQPFLTFIGHWAFGLLATYLKGRQPKPEDRLFGVTKESTDAAFRTHAKRFLGSWQGRNPARPHSLRGAFKTILTGARINDSPAIDRKDVEYFMAHNLEDIEKVYTERDKETWRGIYARVERFLSPENLVYSKADPSTPIPIGPREP
jgi:integrase